MPTQPRQPRQIVIGLIGEVCAGKSTVADSFRRRGALVYEADKHVHELYKRADVKAQVRKLFGDSVFDNEGEVDRKAVAKIVFSDKARLKQLTDGIIFPRTQEVMKQLLTELRSSTAPALVLDAPTLFEAGRDDLCHHILFVTAPLARRMEWAKERGWDVDELRRREEMMKNMSIKRRRADAVITNDGSIEKIDGEVEQLLKQWTGSGS